MDDWKTYIEQQIIPQYHCFDVSHGIEHVRAVIQESLSLAEICQADKRLAYTIAAYHDIGMKKGRDLHHQYSAEYMLNDGHLKKWFVEDDIILMSEAVFDHRASAQHPPRSIYGKIVADADRDLDTDVVIRRSIQYSRSCYPEADKQFIYNLVKQHLSEKYAEGGYLKLCLNVGKAPRQLQYLRQVIADEERLKGYFEQNFDKW
ncbi:MAG: HD domain-containing protein [Bacteroidales bacterium]|nr:HD domain-containing protein [Bacteroidales bacterium]